MIGSSGFELQVIQIIIYICQSVLKDLRRWTSHSLTLGTLLEHIPILQPLKVFSNFCVLPQPLLWHRRLSHPTPSKSSSLGLLRTKPTRFSVILHQTHSLPSFTLHLLRSRGLSLLSTHLLWAGVPK